MLLNLVPVLCVAFMAVPVPDEADAALSEFKRDYKSKDEADRALAVTNLAKTQHLKTLRVLAILLTRDSATVRIEAARGLALFKDLRKKAVPQLQAAMRANKKETAVRAEILLTLGKLGDPKCLPVIHKAFKDKDGEVIVAAVGAAVAMRKKESIPVMVEVALKMEKQMGSEGAPTQGPKLQVRVEAYARLKKLRDAFVNGLQTITKEPWSTAKEWKVWWKRRGKDFKLDKIEE